MERSLTEIAGIREDEELEKRVEENINKTEAEMDEATERLRT